MSNNCNLNFFVLFRIAIDRKIDGGCLLKFCFDDKVEHLSEVKICKNNEWSVLNSMNYKTTMLSTVMCVRVCGLKERERYKLDITINSDESKRHVSVEAFEVVGMYLT